MVTDRPEKNGSKGSKEAIVVGEGGDLGVEGFHSTPQLELILGG